MMMMFSSLSRNLVRSNRHTIRNTVVFAATARTALMSTTHLLQQIKAGEIDPDVLTTGTEISEDVTDLQVTYRGDVTISGVNAGEQILRPAQVQQKPVKIEGVKGKEGALYTLVLTDPDAPDRKGHKFREWCHWIVVNVPVKPGTTELDVSKGETCVEYIGSGPPEGTGLHRYIFVVLEQRDKVQFDPSDKLKNTSGENRGGWKLRDMIKEYNLGKAVSLGCFEAEWDEAVPKLYERLEKGIPADKVE